MQESGESLLEQKSSFPHYCLAPLLTSGRESSFFLWAWKHVISYFQTGFSFLLARLLGFGGCILEFLLCESLARLITAPKRAGTRQFGGGIVPRAFWSWSFLSVYILYFSRMLLWWLQTTWESRPPNPTMHLGGGPSRGSAGRTKRVHLTWGNLNDEENDFHLERTILCGPLWASFVVTWFINCLMVPQSLEDKTSLSSFIQQ